VRRVLPLALAALAGCGTQEGDMAWNSAMDELRGPPTETELAPGKRFVGAGLRFDYPAVLRLRADFQPDGDRGWALEYGMFSLEVDAPGYEITVEDQFEAFAEFLAGGDSIDARPVQPLPPVTLCGREVVPRSMDVKMFGDWSRRIGYDLPAAPGRSRLLLFDDPLIGGHGTALGQATRERVLASLECSPR